MAYTSVTNTFVAGNVSSASNMNQNFTDIVNGLSDGTKDINVNDVTSAGRISGNGGVPSGAIMSFAMSTPPTGWLACDGSAVSRSTYASLFAAISTTWDACRNQSTGSNYSAPAGTDFRLPDLRGTFLRSVGTSSGYSATSLAATQDDLTAKNGLANAASTVTGTTDVAHTHGTSAVSGTVGGSDGTHKHNLNYANRADIGGGSVKFLWGQYTGGYGDGAFDSANGGHGHSFSLTAAGQTLATSNVSLASGSAAAQAITGDTETRPINVGIHYFIKT